MYQYLFDASAIVDFYTRSNHRASRILDHIVEQRTYREAVLFLPTFCITEVFNVLARLCFEQKKLSNAKYKEHLGQFRKHIHWASLFYPYELSRYHVLATDEIIPIEYATERQSTPHREAVRDRLSGIDILLIAMASELSYIHGNRNMYLITGDSRIKRVCENLRNSPKEEREYSREPRPLGHPHLQRWPVPNVFDLHHDVPAVLPTIERQKPLNLRQISS